MISCELFTSTITCLSEILPYGKKLSIEAAGILWLTFPATAKEQLTPAMLQFAVAQRLLDPDPPKEVALHISLLKYVYYEKNGMPSVERGLKKDLHQRMQRPDVYHQAFVRPEYQEFRNQAGMKALQSGSFLSDYLA